MRFHTLFFFLSESDFQKITKVAYGNAKTGQRRHILSNKDLLFRFQPKTRKHPSTTQAIDLGGIQTRNLEFFQKPESLSPTKSHEFNQKTKNPTPNSSSDIVKASTVLIHNLTRNSEFLWHPNSVSCEISRNRLKKLNTTSNSPPEQIEARNRNSQNNPTPTPQIE